jgi:hypothetical protein
MCKSSALNPDREDVPRHDLNMIAFLDATAPVSSPPGPSRQSPTSEFRLVQRASRLRTFPLEAPAQ